MKEKAAHGGDTGKSKDKKHKKKKKKSRHAAAESEGSKQRPAGVAAAAAAAAPAPELAEQQDSAAHTTAASPPTNDGRRATASAAGGQQPHAPAAAAARAAPPAGQVAKRKRRKATKTLTTKGKRAAVLSVVADVVAQRLVAAAAPAAAAPAAAATGSPAPASPADAFYSPLPAAAAAAAPPPPPPPAPGDPASTRNRGCAWSKADVQALARLAEDPAHLAAVIPSHPPVAGAGDLDWELLARHFGRYSAGGSAVKQQYRSVRQLAREARQEGRKGESYAGLVAEALAALPGRQGTVFDVQAYLKKRHPASLDKYKVSGVARWKKAVRDVLHDGAEYEVVSKTATGKNVWRLVG